jgi:Zn ribbon nucleic-acid-binding protein
MCIYTFLCDAQILWIQILECGSDVVSQDASALWFEGQVEEHEVVGCSPLWFEGQVEEHEVVGCSHCVILNY